MARVPIDERREALVRAALRVIAAKGIAAASTRAIVAEAGASLASFHYAFRSHDELMAAVLQHVIEDERAGMLGSLEPGADLRQTVHAGLLAFLAVVRQFPPRELAAFELTWFSLRTPGLESLAVDQYAAYHEGAASLLTLAAESAGRSWSTPMDELARFAVVLTDGITTAWLADRDDVAAERMVALATDALVAHADGLAA